MNGAHLIRGVLRDALDGRAGSSAVHVLGEALELSPATQGLLGTHPERVHLLPAADATLVGVAVGMALSGARPVVELSGPEALWGAVQHLGQEAGSLAGRSEFRARLVLRVPVGQDAFDPTALLAALPGVAIASPSTPSDAAGMLQAALDHDGPVVLLEPRSVLAAHGEATGPVPPGNARIVRAGDHATLLTWGAGVPAAVQAAEDLADQGISVEVLDLGWLRPLDAQTVAASVHRTGRPIVAGPGRLALLAAVEHGFLRLESPPALAAPTSAAMTAAVHHALAW